MDRLSCSTARVGGRPLAQRKRNEAPAGLIPQRQIGAPEAVAQRHPSACLKFRVIPEHLRQAVEGDAAAEMVDVVRADVGGHPPQERRQD
jgi:hypothetical protein